MQFLWYAYGYCYRQNGLIRIVSHYLHTVKYVLELGCKSTHNFSFVAIIFQIFFRTN